MGFEPGPVSEETVLPAVPQPQKKIFLIAFDFSSIFNRNIFTVVGD